LLIQVAVYRRQPAPHAPLLKGPLAEGQLAR
jgi:hypothetical protein